MRQVPRARTRLLAVGDPQIPYCTYYDEKRVAVFRSSQPLVANSSYYLGVFWNSSSQEDIEFLNRARTIGGNASAELLIFDCRPYKNACANRINGGGSEDTSKYENTAVEFLDLPNIHTVNAAFERFRAAVMQRGTLLPSEFHRETSEWLDLLCAIVNATRKVLSRIPAEKGPKSVLIHCSDGWDRTSQLSSLVRLLLDRRSRTTRGFLSIVHRVVRRA